MVTFIAPRVHSLVPSVWRFVKMDSNWNRGERSGVNIGKIGRKMSKEKRLLNGIFWDKISDVLKNIFLHHVKTTMVDAPMNVLIEGMVTINVFVHVDIHWMVISRRVPSNQKSVLSTYRFTLTNPKLFVTTWTSNHYK